MRFLSAIVLASLALAGVDADLRHASTPRTQWKVNSRGNAVKFNQSTSLYMEPSDFMYANLKAQRANAYDNFLRSNIDNEQDKRNFVTEAGRDMLPFRSYEAAETSNSKADNANTVETQIPATAPGPAMTVVPGVPTILPFRWNNPHAAELEVNVWIVNKKYVVPIRKPTCSGEGHQDNVIQFTVPTDFNAVAAATAPGFTGCNRAGDCVLQVYAHSVETRMYASGTPLIINGGAVPANTAPANAPNVKPASIEVGTNINKLPREICLPSNDPSADITKTEVREARLVSDQFNHAYQNSDYSPYAGQQPEAISRNLQAAAVLRMTVGNRGELGKSVLRTNRTRSNLQKSLEKRFEQLYRKYESMVNDIIDNVGNQNMANTDATMGVQKTATCFRCAEVGATNPNRLRTTTYIPSFQLPANLVAQARNYIPPAYAGLINSNNVVQIYVATFNDMSKELQKAAAFDLLYLPAVIKNTATTMADATSFKKIDAAGKPDNGFYAATRAYAAMAAANQKADTTPASPTDTPLTETLRADIPTWPVMKSVAVPETRDMDAMNRDENCETEEAWSAACIEPKPLFAPAPNADDGTLVLAAVDDDTTTTTSSSSSKLPIIIGAAAGGVVLIVAIIAVVYFVTKNKNTASSNQQTMQMQQAKA